MLSKLLLSLVFVIGAYQQATPDIDLTAVVPRNRIREPQTGSSSGGFVGQAGGVAATKNSAQVVLLSMEPSREPEPHITFDVLVRNGGVTELEFPVDPNLADFEPKSANTSYGYEFAYIALFADLKDRGSLFLPGISLFGSGGTKGSFKRLKPGESIRIRGRVALRPEGTDSGQRIYGPKRRVVRSAGLVVANFFAVENRADGHRLWDHYVSIRDWSAYLFLFCLVHSTNCLRSISWHQQRGPAELSLLDSASIEFSGGGLVELLLGGRYAS